MIVVIDTHAHLYDCFDVESVLRLGSRHLLAHDVPDEPGVCVLAFTDRAGQNSLSRVLGFSTKIAGLLVERLDDRLALLVTGLASPLLLIAGRQIITGEGLEIAALACDDSIGDGHSLDETIHRIREAGGVPVLPWSPGKWTLGRARLVRATIESSAAGSLLIGDSTLRPRGWPEPRLFSVARARGLRIVAGSDPLPFAGEERWVGRYGVVLKGDLELSRPINGFRALLLAHDSDARITGARRSLLTVVGRVARLAFEKRR